MLRENKCVNCEASFIHIFFGDTIVYQQDTATVASHGKHNIHTTHTPQRTHTTHIHNAHKHTQTHTRHNIHNTTTNNTNTQHISPLLLIRNSEPNDNFSSVRNLGPSKNS